MDASEEAEAMDGSSSSLKSQEGYSWSCSAMGSGLSLRIETPLRTVPGGAAEGRDGVSVGVLDDAVAEADAYVRESGACRREEHEARVDRDAALNMVAREVLYGT